jgi:hypothetical protein
MLNAILAILGSLIFVIVCVGVPVLIVLFGLERGPSLCRRLWAWVTKRNEHPITGDYYFPPANLADRYKALLKKREEDAAKESELLRKQQDVVVALRSQMLEIVRTETGLELSVTTVFDERSGHRCSFDLGGACVDVMWMQFHPGSTALKQAVDDALPTWTDRLVKNAKALSNKQS